MSDILSYLQQGRYYRAYEISRLPFIKEDYELTPEIYEETISKYKDCTYLSTKKEQQIIVEECIDVLEGISKRNLISKRKALNIIGSDYNVIINKLLNARVKSLISNIDIIESVIKADEENYMRMEYLSLYLKSNKLGKVSVMGAYIKSVDYYWRSQIPLQHLYDNCWKQGSNVVDVFLIENYLRFDSIPTPNGDKILLNLAESDYKDILLSLWYLKHDVTAHITESLENLYKFRLTEIKCEEFGVRCIHDKFVRYFIQYYLKYPTFFSPPKEELQKIVDIYANTETKEQYYIAGLLPSYQVLTIANNTNSEFSYEVRIDSTQTDKFTLKPHSKHCYRQLRERGIRHVSIQIYRENKLFMSCPQVDANSYVCIYGDMNFAIYYEDDVSPESEEVNDFMVKEVSKVLMKEFQKQKNSYSSLNLDGFIATLGCDEVGVSYYVSKFTRELNTLMRPNQLRKCIDIILGKE